MALGVGGVAVTIDVCGAIETSKVSTVACTPAAIVAATSGVALAVGDGSAFSTAACTRASMSGAGVGAEVWPHAEANASTKTVAPIHFIADVPMPLNNSAATPSLEMVYLRWVGVKHSAELDCGH